MGNLNNLDNQGLEVTFRSLEALGAINHFNDTFPLKRPGVMDVFEASVQYPDTPILKIYGIMVDLFSRSSSIWDEKIRPAVKDLKNNLDMLNNREKLHLEAVERFLEYKFDKAFDVYKKLLHKYPHDMQAISMLSLYAIFRGGWKKILAIFDDILEHNTDNIGFLTYFMFYLHLADDPRAVAYWDKLKIMAPEEPFVHHSGAHILSMKYSVDEAIEYLESVSKYWSSGSTYSIIHNWLHLGVLYAWRGDGETALSVYSQFVWANFKEQTFTQMNAVLYLWYLEVAGIDVGGLWEDVASFIEANKAYEDHLSPYIQVIFVYALYRSGKKEIAKSTLKLMKSYGEKQKGTVDHHVWCDVAIPMLEGCMLFADGLYKEASQKLKDIVDDNVSVALGHSDEQRFMFYQTYLVSLLKAGEFKKPKPLIEKLCKNRPLWPLEEAWLQVCE
jgi:tetratricopeptide (TPR) repeat protein